MRWFVLLLIGVAQAAMKGSQDVIPESDWTGLPGPTILQCKPDPAAKNRDHCWKSEEETIKSFWDKVSHIERRKPVETCPGPKEFSTLSGGNLTITCDGEAKYYSAPSYKSKQARKGDQWPGWQSYSSPVTVDHAWVCAKCVDDTQCHLQPVSPEMSSSSASASASASSSSAASAPDSEEDDDSSATNHGRFSKLSKITRKRFHHKHHRKEEKKKIDVLVIILDGCSHSNFERRMKKFNDKVKSLEGKIAMHTFTNLNVNGANSYPNQAHLFAGEDCRKPTDKKEAESEAARAVASIDGIKDTTVCRDRDNPVLNRQNLWSLFKKEGYVTANGDEGGCTILYDEEDMDYKISGDIFCVETQTEDAELYHSGQNPCVHGKFISDYMVDYLLSFFDIHKAKPKFVVQDWMESHEETQKRVVLNEQSLIRLVKALSEKPSMSRTALFLMSDHGTALSARYNHYAIGEIEHRNPLLKVILPKGLEKELGSKVKPNLNKLVTFNDVYKGIGGLSGSKNVRNTPKAVDIFGDVPSSRSCEDAGIPQEWCGCLKCEDSSSAGESSPSESSGEGEKSTEDETNA